MADRVTIHSLPLFVAMAGRPVILLGQGEAATAKRRLLERAGALIVGEDGAAALADGAAALAIVAIDDEAQAEAAVARLKSRGILVNAVDRPDLCDFTLPAIIDRSPVVVAIGTGGASAGLAAALRQRIEGILPAHLGALADALHAARARMRAIWPDAADRRRALARALGPGGPIDPLGADPDIDSWLGDLVEAPVAGLCRIRLASPDPDDLTLRDARALAMADRVYHRPGVPAAIVDRARADAVRIAVDRPPTALSPGLSVYLEMGE